MNGLPIKYRDGSWQVRDPDGAKAAEWVHCESEADAYELANSVEIEHLAIEGERVGEEIATALERAATLWLKYGRARRAGYLREVAKFARHEPSAFDGLLLD